MLRSLLVLLSFILLPASALDASTVLATPTVVKTGTCPGTMTFTVSGATPFGNVALVWGNAGTTVKVGNPCNGMTINVSGPNVAIVRLAGGSGVMVAGGNVPPALCGKSLCAVDLANCTSSAPIIL